MPLSQPVLLCLDTATDRIHAALSHGDALTVLDLPGGAQASAQLLPALGGLISRAGLAWAQVDAIAFGCGPGAFTGLRTACSVAQGLALGLDKPVIALDTLMTVAEDARLHGEQDWTAGETLWVLQDARMDELYVSEFVWGGQNWSVQQAAQLWPLDEPARRWGQNEAKVPRWAGNAAHVYPDRFGFLSTSQVLANGQSAAPRGAALASLARMAWARGQTLDAALALPRYVRDKVAQTTAERQAAAQQGSGAALGRAAPDQA